MQSVVWKIPGIKRILIQTQDQTKIQAEKGSRYYDPPPCRPDDLYILQRHPAAVMTYIRSCRVWLDDVISATTDGGKPLGDANDQGSSKNSNTVYNSTFPENTVFQ